MINRSEIINIMKENEINISRDNINLKETKRVLENILKKLNSAECITDSRFTPYGRMELLIDELDKNIENKKYIDAYYNISDFLSDSRISLNNNPEVVDKNKEYYNEDRICKEEQIIIIEMIDKYLSLINNVLEGKTMNINKKEILKNICDNLNESIDNFEMSRLDEINADIFTLKDNQRGLGGIIIGDDGSSLVCGSIYPISHYIEEFKNGKKDIFENDESLKLSNGKYAADQETKEAFEKYMEEVKEFNDKVERGENPGIKQDELLSKYKQLFYDESQELRLKKTEEDFMNREKDDLIDKIDDKLDNISKDEYNSLFETDDNNAFIRLIIPANEPTNDYPTELNLIGKLPQDSTTDEVIRMKKYSQKMYEKINN